METKIQIKNRFTGDVFFEHNCTTILDCVLVAIKTKADLQGADLQGADLQGANLDFSCWPLWCGSLKVKTDRRLRVQLAYHLASLIVNSDELEEDEKQLLEILKPFANQIHRKDVPRI